MDEKDVVRLAQQGNEEAFSLLVKTYQSKVFSMAMNFVKKREVADDLSQEIFLKAYLSLPKFRFKSEFGTWLYRVAVNHIKDYLRKKGKVREVSLDVVQEVAASPRDEALLREEEKEQEKRKALVFQHLERLPDKYKIILTLRDVQGFSYEEISRVLKISPGTVDSRLHRARKMLRKKLAPYLSQEGGLYAMS